MPRCSQAQLTRPLRHRTDNVLISFGFTENLQNLNNTPDVGLQFGIAWIPNRVR